MKIYDFEQRSDEWYKTRCGLPTASAFDKIITTQGKPSTQAKKYLYKTAGELITGVAEETYQNAAMLRGIELEEDARNLYELVTGNEVEQVGFCVSEPSLNFGCSPDGLIGKDGGLEVKCPIAATHVGYLLDNKLPVEYFQQVQGSMLVTDRKWWDFCSFYPGMKPLIVRVERDDIFIGKLLIELELFADKLKEIVKKIK